MIPCNQTNMIFIIKKEFLFIPHSVLRTPRHQWRGFTYTPINNSKAIISSRSGEYLFRYNYGE